MKHIAFLLSFFLLFNFSHSQTSDLSRGIIFYDNAEQTPNISWGNSKTKGYGLFTYGNQIFGQTQTNGGGGILVSEGFEGAPKARAGNKAYRFRIVKRTDYPACCEWTRAELYWGNGSAEYTGAEWFAQSIFIPADWVHDNRRLAMSFDFKFADAQGPASLHLFMENGQWQINKQYPQGGNSVKQNIGAVEKGKWVDFVFHRNFKDDASGFIEVYLNKQKVYSYNGPNYNMMGNPKAEGYILFGMYKWQYATANGQGEGAGSYNGPITAYFDEIKIMDSRGSLEAVSPGGSAPAPTPVPNPDPVPSPETPLPVFTPVTPDVTTMLATIDLKVFAQHTHLQNPGFIRSFSITQVKGPNTATVSQYDQSGHIPTVTNFKFSNLVNGIYEFKVTTTDNLGRTASDNFLITKNSSVPIDTTNYYVSSIESTEVVNGKTVKSIIITWKDGTKTELYKKP